jgi:hypothetical protein
MPLPPPTVFVAEVQHPALGWIPKFSDLDRRLVERCAAACRWGGLPRRIVEYQRKVHP